MDQLRVTVIRFSVDVVRGAYPAYPAAEREMAARVTLILPVNRKGVLRYGYVHNYSTLLTGHS